MFTVTGLCSTAPGGTTGPFTIALTDPSTGVPYNAAPGGQAFTLSDGGRGGTLTPPSPITVAAGTSSVTFTYANPTAGKYTLAIAPQGGAEANNPAITSLAVFSTTLAWPTLSDVQAYLARAGVNLRVTTASQVILDAVTTEVERRTLRSYIVDPVDTVHIYDGTGSAEQEVDEIVTLTNVTVIGYQSAPGYTLALVYITNELHKPQTRLICARGSLPALIGEGYIAPYPTQFPSGRQNIQVTGRFGYGADIPADLWADVCGEMAYRLAQEAILSPQGGMVIEDNRGDVRKRFQLKGSLLDLWHSNFERDMSDASRGYKRPNGRRLRNLRGRPLGWSAI